jgi:5-(carboxyamino)imidazole ribonucleotide mutase
MGNSLVGIIMGSDSDLDVMSGAAKVLDEFGIANEVRVLSAHRTPDETSQYVRGAAGRGLKIIIAGAGGSAHLAGVTAAQTNMPPGIPLATMPENGGKNAGLMAVRILALSDPELAQKYTAYVAKQHDSVLNKDAKLQADGWQKYLNQ